MTLLFENTNVIFGQNTQSVIMGIFCDTQKMMLKNLLVPPPSTNEQIWLHKQKEAPADS